MNSIRLKMVVMYLMMVFIFMLATGTFTIISINYNEVNKSETDLADAADKIKEAIIDVYSESEFVRELLNLTRPTMSRIEYNILDGEAALIATSVADNPRSIPQYHSSAIISAQSGDDKFNSWRRYRNNEGLIKPWMEYARPVITDGAVTYIIYLRIDATGISNSIRDITIILIWGLLIALAVALILGIFFANSVNKPIVMLTKKAKEFARGDLKQDIKVLSRDEIGQLTESFNHMARELNSNILGIENEKNKMEIVLHNMTDGVLAYDISGKPVHGNHVCRELLGIPDSDINTLTLDEMLERLNLKERDKAEAAKDMVLHINDRYINVIFNYYNSGKGGVEGVILLLQDLTKHIMLDNMRKEFVANVSHELRTPLTTIKSYAETLLEELSDGTEESVHIVDFLNTINGETDRMTVLVNDLLELSRLDNKQLTFNMQTINLADLVSQNIKKHIHALKKKHSKKTILFAPPDNEMLIDADTERINQILNNIITNSLRYSGDNAIVEVSLCTSGNHHNVIIKDNGTGIPETDLNRIFERFYRVDKARSRELGGTGLGLSISKDIIEAHGGRITAESTLNKGTTMTICLKKHKD